MSINSSKRMDPLPTVFPLVSTGGVGGGLYSRSSEKEEEKEILPPPQSESDGTSIASTLLELGVFILAPAKMRATATTLAAAGVEPQQLRELAAFIAEAEDDAGKQRKYLASILVDSARTKEALGNVAAHKAARISKATDGPSHAANMPVGSACCPCNACVAKRCKTAAEPWDHDWQCRVAYCLHNSDRRTVADLAAFLAVSESTARLMVDRGRVLSQSPYLDDIKAPRDWKRIERDEKGGAERLREFREATRSGRLRLLQGEA